VKKPVSAELTRDSYLHALALYVMAADHAAKAQALEKALARHLGCADEFGYMGHVTDGIWGGETSIEEFDLALERQGFTIPEELNRSRASDDAARTPRRGTGDRTPAK
jgi:hypothetical protein